MNDATYRFIANLIRFFIWQGWKKSAHLQGVENLPESGPAVFIGNRINALGPIGCVSMIPALVRSRFTRVMILKVYIDLPITTGLRTLPVKAHSPVCWSFPSP